MKPTLITCLVSLMMSASFAQTSIEKLLEPPPPPELVTEVHRREDQILIADSFGKTLYVFDLDLDTKTSACTGDCAEVWPPYILSKSEIASLKAPLGSITRTNRKVQLTYEGRPVYTYIFDRAKADILGEDVGGVWHIIQTKSDLQD